MKWIFKTVFLCLALTVFITAGLMTTAMAEPPAGGQATAQAAESPKPSRYLVATYFHNTFRCPTCKTIEAFSAETINSHFAEQLKNGSLVWRAVNVDEPGNAHYVQDYQLYTKHLILSEVRDGKETRWKDLKEIWTTVRNREKFDQYVVSEITDWLKEP
ncbi:MAG: nitrophenyl compound nitroreductase subunit ArsF family protein [Thermodesulfobacteriota bacterium]